ncbi:hypothetical protein BGX28_006127 [Mortierella sp. GBA30]|nr:hypothetical protein BGX28_006127 [Mortierella sp. GBA30]
MVTLQHSPSRQVTPQVQEQNSGYPRLHSQEPYIYQGYQQPYYHQSTAPEAMKTPDITGHDALFTFSSSAFPMQSSSSSGSSVIRPSTSSAIPQGPAFTTQTYYQPVEFSTDGIMMRHIAESLPVNTLVKTERAEEESQYIEQKHQQQQQFISSIDEHSTSSSLSSLSSSSQSPRNSELSKVPPARTQDAVEHSEMRDETEMNTGPIGLGSVLSSGEDCASSEE